MPFIIDSIWDRLDGVGSQEINPINLVPCSLNAASRTKNMRTNTIPIASMKVYSVTYDALQAYVLEAGSFSGMRTLYTRYAGFMAEEDRRLLARVIRNARPPEEWSEWLTEEPSGSSASCRPGERTNYRNEDPE